MASGLFGLSGRKVLMTGAARGLGSAMAEALARAGAHVILNDIDEATLQARCAELAAAGLSTEPSVFDVCDADAVDDGFRRIGKKHGSLDVLVNNAGIAVYKGLADHEPAEWDRVLDVDLKALYLVARAAALIMPDHAHGRIINIASVLGLISRPGILSYVVAKHGVIGMTRALAAELGPRGITCNAIAPGYFETPMSEHLTANSSFKQMIEARTPLKRWGDPKELAGPILFLASAASSFVTGQTVVVDGGLTASLFPLEMAPSD